MNQNAAKSDVLPVTLWTALCLIAALAFAPSARAQQKKSKVPVIGRLESNSNRLAFSGKVQSVDLKAKILNVNALQGRDTEIFPLRKSTRIEGVDGKRLKLKALVPGTSVLIYYEQKKGEREIKNIMVLGNIKSQTEANAAPGS